MDEEGNETGEPSYVAVLDYPEEKDEEGNVIIPSGKVLRAIPVEERREEDGEPVDSLEQALPAIPVDDAPVAIPVEEGD